MTERRTKHKRKIGEALQTTLEPSIVAKPSKGLLLLHIVELGKFFIDIAKLIFGGVILTILLDYRDYKMPLLISGLLTLVFFVILGTMIIKKANNN